VWTLYLLEHRQKPYPCTYTNVDSLTEALKYFKTFLNSRGVNYKFAQFRENEYILVAKPTGTHQYQYYVKKV
jgi:glutaredoxin-related protein